MYKLGISIFRNFNEMILKYYLTSLSCNKILKECIRLKFYTFSPNVNKIQFIQIKRLGNIK